MNHPGIGPAISLWEQVQVALGGWILSMKFMTAHDSSVIEATRPTSQGSPSFSRDSASLFLIRSAASLFYPKHHIVHLLNSERKKTNKQNTCQIPSILYIPFFHSYLKRYVNKKKVVTCTQKGIFVMAKKIAPGNWYRYRWSCTLGTGPGATRRSSNTQALKQGIERFNSTPKKQRMNFHPKKMGKFSEFSPRWCFVARAASLVSVLKKKSETPNLQLL